MGAVSAFTDRNLSLPTSEQPACFGDGRLCSVLALVSFVDALMVVI